MDELESLRQYGLSNILPVFCGTALIKTEIKSTSSVNRKQDFLILIDNAIKSSNFKLLSVLKKWINLTVSDLNDNIFFAVYNTISRYSVKDIMNYFNSMRDKHLSRNSSFQNNSLLKLAIQIMNLNENESFLDPVATSTGAWLEILKENSDQNITIQTYDDLEACFAYLNVKANEGKNVTIYNQNILAGPKYINKNKELIRFDRSITTPPLGRRISNDIINNSYNFFKYGDIGPISADWGYASSVIGSLKDNGRAAIFMVTGSLFGSGKKETVRNNILKDDKIEAVISFPERFYAHALVPINLVVFNNHKVTAKGKVLFIDANQSEWIKENKLSKKLTVKGIQEILDLIKHPRDIVNISKLVAVSDCQKSLMVNEYITKNRIDIDGQKYHVDLEALKHQQTIPIKEIVTIKRGYNMMRDNEDKNSDLKVLKISDFGLNRTINYEALTGVKQGQGKSLDEYRIHKKDIILAVRGSIGKAVYIADEPDTPTIISSNMVIIRVKHEDVDSEWLYLYLNSLFTKYFIQRTESGTTVSILTVRNLENLPVILSSKDKQKETVEFYKKKCEQVEFAQKKLEKEKAELESHLGELFGSDAVFFKE